jgi:SpoVK/Ycf46/Vps4 family AAA+-type ATPase
MGPYVVFEPQNTLVRESVPCDSLHVCSHYTTLSFSLNFTTVDSITMILINDLMLPQPGCGKTLTAEAISELLKKPLYIVTAGDLGITASEVEKTLGSVLDLCQTWDALVLIDEADVFLEARNSTELQRNALVCVMLRLLEYYSGCLFLSSNRSAGSIDAAIASRITVMLSYPPLDTEGRAKVWKNLIELLPPQPVDPTTGEVPTRISKNPRKASKYRMDFSDSDYQHLASGYQMNGRQIKNSIVLARALARERGMPVSLPILHRAVTAVAGEEAVIAGKEQQY